MRRISLNRWWRCGWQYLTGIAGAVGRATQFDVGSPSRSRRTPLRRFSIRRHRSEIMLGVLVVVLRADDIPRLGLSLGESNIPLIASLRVLGAPLLGTGDVRCPL